MITKTKAQNWQTPRALFNTLNADYAFDVDCFASIRNHLLPVYWTAAHDAFARRLRGRAGFCNPPFGMLRRALEWGYAQRHESFTCFLVPANVETAWFHELAIMGDKHLFRGRVAYVPPPGVDVSQPSFASMLCMFGPYVKPSGLSFTRLRLGTTGEYV